MREIAVDTSESGPSIFVISQNTLEFGRCSVRSPVQRV